MLHRINSFNWARQNIKKTKSMMQDILNKMKKNMKFDNIKKTSIFNVEQNLIIVNTANQSSFATKTINSEKTLTNQKLKEDSVTISC
jgi:hypothetical protein